MRGRGRVGARRIDNRRRVFRCRRRKGVNEASGVILETANEGTDVTLHTIGERIGIAERAGLGVGRISRIGTSDIRRFRNRLSAKIARIDHAAKHALRIGPHARRGRRHASGCQSSGIAYAGKGAVHTMSRRIVHRIRRRDRAHITGIGNIPRNRPGRRKHAIGLSGRIDAERARNGIAEEASAAGRLGRMRAACLRLDVEHPTAIIKAAKKHIGLGSTRQASKAILGADTHA